MEGADGLFTTEKTEFAENHSWDLSLLSLLTLW
jgi:hypothetical protein